MISVKLNVPPLPFDHQKVERAVSLAVDATLRSIKQDFERSCATFRHKPRFQTTYYRRKDLIAGEVFTVDENYSRLNHGTRPRVIRSSKVMRFRPGYSPKTRPGLVHARGSVRSGMPLFRKAVGTVRPHRIRARRFDLTIAQAHRQSLYRNLTHNLHKL